jgi:hypothetical protein
MKFDLIVEETLKGLAKGKTLEDIAKEHSVSIEHLKKQLEMGIEVETNEHTKNDESIGRKIAMDHLFENPNYYTDLNKMENKG